MIWKVESKCFNLRRGKLCTVQILAVNLSVYFHFDKHTLIREDDGDL